ncbi:MAG: DUF4340 domain-containing protein [Candidatus Peregrinibacteria bacterium]
MNFLRTLQKLGPLKLATLLFVLLALFILIVEKPGSQSTRKQEEAEPMLFPRLKLEAVTNVVIRQPDQPEITLRKTEGGWQMGEEAVAPQKAEDFITAIQNLKSTGLISRNPSKQSLFGVDSADAVRIQAWRNTKNLADFYVGKSAGLGTAYVRLEGSDEVVQAAPLLPEFNFAP